METHRLCSCILYGVARLGVCNVRLCCKFFKAVLITVFLKKILNIKVVRGQLNWTVKHHGDMNGVYLNVGQFVAIIAASAFGLLNLRSDDEEGEQKQQTSTNTNLYVGILTFVSGAFKIFNLKVQLVLIVKR